MKVVTNEISKRGLNPRLTQALEFQNREYYSIEEIDRYCELINRLHYPVCNKQNGRLNGTLTAEVMSFIIISQYKKKVHIGCPDCFDMLSNAALSKTVVLGWWAVPWGIVRAVQSIIINIKSKRTNHMETPNQFLRHFVLSDIGETELYKDDKESLSRVMRRVLE